MPTNVTAFCARAADLCLGFGCTNLKWFLNLHMCDVLLQTLFFSFMVIQFCYFLVVKNKFFFLHNLHKHNISKTVILLKRNIKSLVLICFDWANRRYYTFWRISNCLPCFFFLKNSVKNKLTQAPCLWVPTRFTTVLLLRKHTCSCQYRGLKKF